MKNILPNRSQVTETVPLAKRMGMDLCKYLNEDECREGFRRLTVAAAAASSLLSCIFVLLARLCPTISNAISFGVNQI